MAQLPELAGLVLGAIRVCLADGKAFGFGMAFAAIIAARVVDGITGGSGAATGAVVYNLAVRWAGRLEVDLS